MKTIKTMQAVALASIFAVAGCGRPDETYKTIISDNNESVSLRQCFDNKGVQVRARFQTASLTVQEAQWGAISTYAPITGPLVTFVNVEYMSADLLAFAWEHECAHHSLGHARELYNSSMIGDTSIFSKLHQYEYEADCTAAAKMSAEGRLNEKQLRAVMAKFPHIENSATHPVPADRIQQALACMR